MSQKAWGLVFGVSLIILGALGVLSVANMIAAGNGAGFLPDIARRVIGIADMVCLFLFVFSGVKRKH